MSLRVMIIDDHAAYRALLAQHITVRWPGAVILDYDPVQSGTLPDSFSGAGHDLVLLGDSTGGGQGLEWLRRFRGIPHFPPVLYFGSGEEREIVSAIKAGAEDYLSKPKLGHAQLMQAVEQALRAGSSPARLGNGLDATAGITLRGYEIQRRLAGGGLSSVYLGRERAGGREVALKVIGAVSGPAATGPDAGVEKLLDRFLQEYELIARIRHPNVVRIYDLGVADDHAYIAMEYCSGGSLKQRISGGLAPEQAFALMRDMAGALGALHGVGILHRDLKPSNVLFRADGSLALIDFGLARQMALPGDITGLGAIFGTPYYMSPEQGHGEPVDERGDLYSLGVILYEMLTGQKPYDGRTAMSVIIQHRLASIPVLPAELARFQPLIARLLAKDPADRFQSTDELLGWQPG